MRRFIAILILLLLIPTLVLSAPKKTFRGKIKTIDYLSGIVSLEGAFGKVIEFSLDKKTSEKLIRADISVGDRITIWYIEEGGKNKAFHIRLETGCG